MEYLKRFKLKFEKGEYKNPVKGEVRLPKEIYAVFKDIKDNTKETLIGVYLNEMLKINTYEVLSIGGHSVALVLSDDIFSTAILTRSKYIILIHNHPSGKAVPSAEDEKTMQVLIRQARILDKYLLDFIIVGDKSYWSMFEKLDGKEYTMGAVA